MSNATVIDALVVTLGLDDSDYEKKYKQLLENQNKLSLDLEANSKKDRDNWKKTGEAIDGVKNQVLGLLAALGATMGFKQFLVDNIQGQAALGRLSDNLDINAKRLEAWGLVAQEVGGQASDAFTALQNVAGGLAEAAIKGHSGFTDAARANGVVLTDAQGRLLDYEHVLINVSKRMKELPRQQAMWLANQLGVGSMFNELELGPQELQSRLEHAAQLSKVTDESVRRAQELQKQWADIRQRFKAASETAFSALAPHLERLLERFTNWLDSIDWDTVGSKLEKLVDQVGDVIEEFGGWKVAAIAVGAALSLKLLAPLLGIISAIPKLSMGTSAISSFGTALAAIDLTALAGVLAAAGIVYSPTLGGKKRADGSYDDEAARPTGTAPGMDNASLWAKVHGQKSSYLGTAMSAALVLAQRTYNDQMDFNTIEAQAKDILNGKWTEKDSKGTNADPEAGRSKTASTNAELFARLEKEHNLPAGLLNSVYMAESSGGKNLLSPKGAQGPFQMMPATAAQYGLRGDDVYDTSKSASAAAAYLDHLKTMFHGDMTKAVAAYNAGEGNVQKYGGVPPFEETQAYVGKVLGGIKVGAGSNVASARPSVNNTTETHIGKIEVHTPATNGVGVANDMRRDIEQNGLIAQVDTGLN
jgi:soluble lytic murein transglycosylase-like protein